MAKDKTKPPKAGVAKPGAAKAAPASGAATARAPAAGKVKPAFGENGAVLSRDAGVALTENQRRLRRSRSIAIALVLGALCVLFYVVTIVKLGPSVLIRPL